MNAIENMIGLHKTHVPGSVAAGTAVNDAIMVHVENDSTSNYDLEVLNAIEEIHVDSGHFQLADLKQKRKRKKNGENYTTNYHFC